MEPVTPEERVSYIAKCEASVVKQREQVASSMLRQEQFDARMAKVIQEVVEICNAPLYALIKDIREAKNP